MRQTIQSRGEGGRGETAGETLQAHCATLHFQAQCAGASVQDLQPLSCSSPSRLFAGALQAQLRIFSRLFEGWSCKTGPSQFFVFFHRVY